MANEHMGRYLTFLLTGEMKTKATYDTTSPLLTTISSAGIPVSFSKDVQKLELSHPAQGDVNGSTFMIRFSLRALRDTELTVGTSKLIKQSWKSLENS